MSLEIGNLPVSILTAEDKFLANRLGTPVQVPLFVLFENKQDKLTAGFNIKNINGVSMLGAGDIVVAASWGDLTGKPLVFPPDTHSHAIGDVTGLTSALSGKASTTHSHATADVTGLDFALAGKASTVHTHIIDDVFGLTAGLAGKQASLVSGTNIKTLNGTSLLGSGDLVVATDWASISGKPALFTPSVHTHEIADVLSLDATLSGKQPYLISGVNIKTVNGETLLGSGDILGLTVAEQDKLTSLDYGATRNSPDAILFNRQYHSGEQDISTITGLRAALDAAGGGGGGGATDLSYTASTRVLASSTGADATLPLVNSTEAGLAPLSGGGTTNFLRADGTWAAPAAGGLSDGDKGDVVVSASGATWTVDAGVVTNAKLATVATATLKGRSTAGTGAVEDLSAATARTLLNVADGATRTIKGTATVTVANNRQEDTEIVTAVGVTPSSMVQVWLAPTTSDDENEPEMLDLMTIGAVPLTDQIEITLSFSAPTAGPVKLNWSAM
jgi:hypothetical protein